LCAIGIAACDPSIVLGDRPSSPSDAAAEIPEPGDDGSPSRPERGNVLWSTDHETGDLSAWELGGAASGGQYYWSTGTGRVVSGSGRGESRALECVIDTAGDEPSHGARVYRRVDAAPAFYSAWFFLEEPHTVTNWWAIFLFHARDDSLSLDNYRSLWDVRVVRREAGNMALQFFDHDTATAVTAEPGATVVAGRWFQIEAYLDYRPPAATRLDVRLDGVSVFEREQLVTAMEANVFWVIGNGGAGLEPTRSTVLIDDAAITAARAGT
jgi:hypothetical protein